MFRGMCAMILIVSLASCLQTENSNSLDADTYSDDGSGTAEFRAAKTIFKQSCAGCHQYHTRTEVQLKSDGVLAAGSPDTSSIYFRLAGASGGSGPKNMPQGGSLSSSDIQTIRFWVLNAVP